jgi:hypothetical protein
MIHIFGLIIVIAGFIVPFLSGGRVPYEFFFWFGFLLLLRPNKYFPPGRDWAKYARIGLLVHVLGILAVLNYRNLVVNTSLFDSYLAYLSLTAVNYIFNPISSLFRLIFPGQQFALQDGGITFTSFIRGPITGFLNILLYVCVGAMIGKWKRTRSGRSEVRKGSGLITS